MDTNRSYSLCPDCDACPEVIITPDEVTIGEAENKVKLSAAEWNVLVAGVKSGELAAVAGATRAGESDDCGCGCDCC